ncbi:MAG: hypothetical protein JNL75_11890 [Chitinophagales bacterium]|nr:hypothetical protein [Chitinophagales bacterium]
MSNLLEKWNSELISKTSFLSIYPKTRYDRNQISFVYETLKKHFGLDYFDMQNEREKKAKNDSWLYYLLANFEISGTIFALIEIAHILENKSLFSNGMSKKLKSLHNDSRQLGDILFELYVANILDYNGISLKKNPKDKSKPLDAVFTINDIEFLGECRKLHSKNFNELKVLSTLIQETIPNNLKKNSTNINLVGILIIDKVNENYFDTINEIDITLNEIILNINTSKSIYLPIEYKKDSVQILIANSSSLGNDFFNSFDGKQYLKFQTINGEIQMHLSINFTKAIMNAKLLKSLDYKNLQHINSEYENKIFFIDNEINTNIQLPLFPLESFFDERIVIDYIKENFPKNYIFCFILRNYSGDFPVIKIKALGNNISPYIKTTLETLKTNFAYRS